MIKTRPVRATYAVAGLLNIYTAMYINGVTERPNKIKSKTKHPILFGPIKAVALKQAKMIRDSIVGNIKMKISHK